MSIKYVVAVWWPKDGGYGGATFFDTLADAQADAEKLKRLHFGTKRNPIHILRRTADEIVQVIDNAELAAFDAETAGKEEKP